MEYRNLLNFILSLLLVFSLIFFVPFVNSVISALAITFFGIKLAEWFTEISRKYFLYKQVSPNNKVVLITGCSSGFGNVLARRMDKLGYSVLATCRNPDGEGPVKLAQECSEKLTVLPMDITDEQSIEKVKEFTEKNFGRNALWAVVNNAGVPHCGLVEWTSVEEFQKVSDVNTFGALRVTKAFLPFIKQSKGRIVNVTSAAGYYTIPGGSAYSMSKSAAVDLVTGLQMELSKWGVKCIDIAPFTYSTPFIGASLFTVMNKTWNEAPTDVKAEYGSDYFEAFKTTVARYIHCFSNSDLSEAIDCLEDAITAQDPLPVYIPANIFHRILALLLDRCLPLRMKVYLAGCFLDLGGKPLSLRRQKKKQ